MPLLRPPWGYVNVHTSFPPSPLCALLHRTCLKPLPLLTFSFVVCVCVVVILGVFVQDIDYFFEQYEKEVEGYDALIEKLQSLGDGAKAKTVTNTLADCEAKAARIKEIKKSMGLELKLVKNKQERAEYDAAIKEIDERVAILNKDLKLAKAQHDKNDLFQDKKGMRNQFSSEGKNNEELLEGANQIQDLTFDSLARTRGLIEASKEVGTATIEELRRQKGQIEDIENEVDIIDSNLKRAERLLFNFSRRMATDRIIQVRLPACLPTPASAPATLQHE